MERYPDPPHGWAELRTRMVRAKSAEEINQILEEMYRVLNRFEAKMDGRKRLQTSIDRGPDHHSDRYSDRDPDLQSDSGKDPQTRKPE
jgi:hypothetical protein